MPPSNEHPLNHVCSQEKISSSETNSPNLSIYISRLQRMAKANGWDIPEDVARYIVKQPHTNIQELEEAFMRVIAYSSLVNQDLSVELTVHALDAREASSTTPAKDAPGVSPTYTSQYSSHQVRDRGIYKRAIDVFLGSLEGFALSLLATGVMLCACFVIDYICYAIHIMTLSVSWLWWTVVILNALTVLIPIDICRYLKNQSNRTVRSRVRITCLFVLESIPLSAFVILLFGFQEIDISIFQHLT